MLLLNLLNQLHADVRVAAVGGLKGGTESKCKTGNMAEPRQSNRTYRYAMHAECRRQHASAVAW